MANGSLDLELEAALLEWLDAQESRPVPPQAGVRYDLEPTFDMRRARDGRLVAVPRLPGGLRVSPETLADLPAVLGILDMWRKAKARQYHKMRSNPAYRGPIIIAEGDSWLELPLGPEQATGDIVRGLWKKYAILSLAKAGDTWLDVISQNELISTVDAHKASDRPTIVLFSVAGNSVLGEPHLFARQYKHGAPDEYYLIRDKFEGLMNEIIDIYRSYIEVLVQRRVHVIVQGYDYPDPRPGGYLIGGPLAWYRGIESRDTWRAIVNEMVDIFNARLARLPSVPDWKGFVHYVNLVGTVGDDSYDWYDEVHPMPWKFQELAQKIDKVIAKIS